MLFSVAIPPVPTLSMQILIFPEVGVPESPGPRDPVEGVKGKHALEG